MVEHSSLVASDYAHQSPLRKLPKPSQWVLLLGLAPLLVAILWGSVYADAAYRQFGLAQVIAAGQEWRLGGFSPLYTLLLALAALLHLPLPLVAMALSVLGWAVAIAAWALIGLALHRPAFSLAAAILLTLHPWQGQALGLEPGLVLGLWGLATWWTVRGRTVPALVTMLALAAVQPLALAYVVPQLVVLVARRRYTRVLADKDRKSPRVSAFICIQVAIGAVCYALVCTLRHSWSDPRLTVPLLAALDILAAAGFAALVPDLSHLVQPNADWRTVGQGVVVLALAALAIWQGSTLVQDWRLRPVERQALYQGLAQWLRANALPAETVAVQQAGLLGYLTERPTLPLPDDAAMQTLLAALDQARPDYCIATNGLAWQDLRRQPWFQERYQGVYALASPYDAATPLTVFRYIPSPFDDGEIISTTMTFTVNTEELTVFRYAPLPLNNREVVSTAMTFAVNTAEQVELTGYRLDSSRLTPGEPLHLTLYWRAVTAIRQPWRLVVRLVDPVSGRVWVRAENSAPGGLATDLWDAGARFDDRYALTPPPDIPPGGYVLQLAWVLPNGSTPAMEGASDGRVALAQVSHPPDVSAIPLTPDHPLDATFGSEIELLGYDVQGRVAPGQTLRVALYWRARQPVPLGYKVFVHLLAAGDQPLAQDDSIPVGWTVPTTSWQPGETIRDEHLLTIPPSAPRGDYALFVGLYDPATGDRPQVRDAAGNDVADRRILLQTIQVR
jgi:hypothetical protein